MNGPNPHFHVEVDLKKIGRWLRLAREEQHLSIRELAKLCNMSATQVTRMEVGDDFTLSKLVQLAVPLGIPPAVLVDAAIAVRPGFRAEEHQTALVTDDELFELVTSAGYDLAHATMSLIDLVDVITVCACQLLISANPQAVLASMDVPLPTLRNKLAQLVEAYGLETETTERAAVFRAIAQRPFRKLRALGLLSKQIAEEYLQSKDQGNKNLSQDLKVSQEVGSSGVVPNQPSEWSQLVARAIKATSGWGAKAQLARDMGVTSQAVNQWLTGANAPSAETTLRLLQWVTAAEAKKK